ncbi:hypothetical protein V5O48_002125 [Marasmius crinis-equi]|uniref:DUF654-domain-containing protein n=1 Tax=Marasmius crinis-equi TaxID=585013 RepID=A0ABR3FXA6_9AGAR
MPPRLSKRQQRAIDELEELSHAGISKPEESEGSEEEVLNAGRPGQSGFAALFAPDDDGGEDETTPAKSSKSKKSKKKKKTGTGTSTPAKATDTPPNVPTPEALKLSQSEKKAAKKAKAKAKKEKEKENDGLDEIDRALEALSMKHPEFQKPVIATSSTPGELSTSQGLLTRLSPLISVSLTHLDSSAELRRFFGSKVVKSSAAQDSPSRGSSSRRGRTNAKQPATERSNLTRPQPGWPPAKMREGVSLRMLDDEERARKKATSVAGERWWTVEYGKKYKSVTKIFLRTVLSGDPQGFYDLLYRTPWHADTLLQLSEVYRHRDEHAQAIDLIERALFAYERAFLGMGSFNLTSGVNRLDFDRVENRVFYMAVHRVVADLTRRGLTRTAFEFARLLWALDPWTDPHGALLHLEFLASKGMSDWMEDVSQVFESHPKECQGKMDPTVLPGWTWSRAVVMRLSIEEPGKGAAERAQLDKKSTDALIEAIKSFPSILPLLADKIDAVVPDSVRGLKECRIEVDGSSLSQEQTILHLLSHLYVQRASSLWKAPAISSWFTETVRNMFSSPPKSLPPTPRRTRFLELYSPASTISDALLHSAWRHIMVLESSYRSLLKFIPRSVLESRSLSCDPLPPPTRVSEYDAEFFAGVEDDAEALGGRRRRMTRAQREADERRLAQLVPDVGFRQQIQVGDISLAFLSHINLRGFFLQAIFEANPILAERIPGGVFEFAQRLAQMPADMLDDLMAHAAAQNEAGVDGQEIFVGEPGAMPGGFDVDDGDAVPDVLEPGRREAEGPRHEEEEEDGDNDAEEDDEEAEEEEIAPMPVRMIRNLIGRFWGSSATNNGEEDSEDDEHEELRDRDGVD